MFVGGLSDKNLCQMLKQQTALIVGVVVVGQERKRADVDRLDAFEEVAVAHGFIVASAGKQDVASDNLFCRVEAYVLHLVAIIDGIAVAVHLVDGVARWIVGGTECVDFIFVFFREFVVVTHPILCVEEVGELETVGLAYGEHYVGAVVGGGCVHVAAGAVVGVLIVQPDLVLVFAVVYGVLLAVVGERLDHRHRILNYFIIVAEVQTQNFCHHLAHLQEAPQFIEFPYWTGSDLCAAVEKFDAFLKHNPVAVHLRVAGALLQHQALGAQRFGFEPAQQR